MWLRYSCLLFLCSIHWHSLDLFHINYVILFCKLAFYTESNCHRVRNVNNEKRGFRDEVPFLLYASLCEAEYFAILSLNKNFEKEMNIWGTLQLIQENILIR